MLRQQEKSRETTGTEREGSRIILRRKSIPEGGRFQFHYQLRPNWDFVVNLLFSNNAIILEPFSFCHE